MGDSHLLEKHLPLVRKIAADVRRSFGPTLELDDLVAYGASGLLEAHQRYDPSRGARFTTFAYYRIRGAMIDGLRKTGWRPAQPRKLAFARGANDVLEQAAADAGSVSDTQAVEAAIDQVAAVYIVSLAGERAPQVADPSPGAESELVASGERRVVRDAVKQLPEKERRLLELMYFEDKSLTDSGKELGLSKSWSSRLHARALKLLAEAMSNVREGDAQPPSPATR